MGVGDHHIINVGRGEIQLVVVPLVPALLEPAVHQHLVPIGLNAVAASGDCLGRAKKCKLQLKALLSAVYFLCTFPKYIVYPVVGNVKGKPPNFHRISKNRLVFLRRAVL